MTTTSHSLSKSSGRWAIARCVFEWLNMGTFVLSPYYWFDGSTLSRLLDVVAISMIYGGLAIVAEEMRRHPRRERRLEEAKGKPRGPSPCNARALEGEDAGVLLTADRVMPLTQPA